MQRVMVIGSVVMSAARIDSIDAGPVRVSVHVASGP